VVLNPSGRSVGGPLDRMRVPVIGKTRRVGAASERRRKIEVICLIDYKWPYNENSSAPQLFDRLGLNGPPCRFG
jgi:hypothetical protein